MRVPAALVAPGLAVAVLCAGLARATGGDLRPPVAVIVHISNPVDQLSAAELRDLLQGGMKQWPNHRRVTIAQRQPGSLILESVLRDVLGSSPQDYNRFVLSLEFRGLDRPALKTLNSDDGACAFVTNVPGAIGFIAAPSARLPSCIGQVKVVRIAHRSPEDPDYLLR